MATTMIEIAGLLLNGLGFTKDLIESYNDFTEWEEKDLLVDAEWLPLSLSQNFLTGNESDYCWKSEQNVPTLELKKSHRVLKAYSEKNKTSYRIVRGPNHDRVILMQKISSE